MASFAVEALERQLERSDGAASDGRQYVSLAHMWDDQLAAREGEGGQPWYRRAASYWDDEEKAPATVDGVLGGYGFVSGTDLRGSHIFLAELRRRRPALGRRRAVDCGAGIGRCVRDLLLHHFQRVELCEQSERLLRSAPAYLGEELSSRCDFTCLGMQDYAPPPASLDCVWIQWAVGHLHDDDFVAFFRRMKEALAPGGVVIVKDNCIEESKYLVDTDDSSIIRSYDYFHRLFELCGAEVIHEDRQRAMPDELYPVWMFALAL